MLADRQVVPSADIDTYQLNDPVRELSPYGLGFSFNLPEEPGQEGQVPHRTSTTAELCGQERAMLDSLSDVVAHVPGARITEFRLGYGGWQDAVEPACYLGLFTTDARAKAIAASIGIAARQDSVLIWQPGYELSFVEIRFAWGFPVSDFETITQFWKSCRETSRGCLSVHDPSPQQGRRHPDRRHRTHLEEPRRSLPLDSSRGGTARNSNRSSHQPGVGRAREQRLVGLAERRGVHRSPPFGRTSLISAARRFAHEIQFQGQGATLRPLLPGPLVWSDQDDEPRPAA